MQSLGFCVCEAREVGQSLRPRRTDHCESSAESAGPIQTLQPHRRCLRGTVDCRREGTTSCVVPGVLWPCWSSPRAASAVSNSAGVRPAAHRPIADVDAVPWRPMSAIAAPVNRRAARAASPPAKRFPPRRPRHSIRPVSRMRTCPRSRR